MFEASLAYTARSCLKTTIKVLKPWAMKTDASYNEPGFASYWIPLEFSRKSDPTVECQLSVLC
jgi:hypothetical protein